MGLENSVATVERITIVGNKSNYQDIGVSFRGYLKPMKNNFEPFGGDSFGKSFLFTIKGVGLNIKPADKLTIDGEKYNVNSVAPYNGPIKLTRVILFKND